ncbi:hypothetical protein [Anaerosporobacter faecicola]|uniref:hypothetical protein n=1 Tax=Anaerosporobacter faecicola TaxID=2718714 RepID=UPI0014388D83|nr:hypothetical protein [Anaerosporobacter faecicola]
MKRPYVQAKGTNQVEELKEELRRHLPLFQQYEGIAGIMLDGGMSRGFADALSEIDVVLFLHKEEFNAYHSKLTPTALGITMIDNYLYDIKLCCYEEEMERSYGQLELWDLSYAQILYDPKKELQHLFDEKLKETVEPSTASGYLFDAWWHYRLAGDIWIAREDCGQGHYVLNAAIAPLLSALYIINKEYIPHEKWLIHMSRSLVWLPENYEQQLEQLLCVKDFTLPSLKDRQTAFHQLWNQLDEKLCTMTSCPAGLNLMHQGAYQSLYELYEEGEISLTDWCKCHSIEELNYDPLNKIAKLEQDSIVFQYDRLQSLTEQDMYSWFYQLVKVLEGKSRL